MKRRPWESVAGGRGGWQKQIFLWAKEKKKKSRRIFRPCANLIQASPARSPPLLHYSPQDLEEELRNLQFQFSRDWGKRVGRLLLCVRVERVAFSIGWVCPGECEVCRSNSTGQNMRRVRLNLPQRAVFRLGWSWGIWRICSLSRFIRYLCREIHKRKESIPCSAKSIR